MKILGFDPGSRVAGWGLINKSGNQLSYLASGVLKFEKKEKDFLARFPHFHIMTKEILEIHRPDVVVFESLIFKKNPQSLMKLAQARGAMLSTVSLFNPSSLYEYSPNLVKSTLTGHGHADKEGVQRFLRLVLGVQDFISDDESDALAIAICHAILGSQAATSNVASKSRGKKGRGSSLARSLSHRIGE